MDMTIGEIKTNITRYLQLFFTVLLSLIIGYWIVFLTLIPLFPSIRTGIISELLIWIFSSPFMYFLILKISQNDARKKIYNVKKFNIMMAIVFLNFTLLILLGDSTNMLKSLIVRGVMSLILFTYTVYVYKKGGNIIFQMFPSLKIERSKNKINDRTSVI
jgi:hypothetical protein